MDPSLYVVLDRAAAGGRDLVDILDAALAGGSRLIQLREKEWPSGRVLPLAERLRARCAAARATFIVNDRVDLAVAAGADGVHLPSDGVPTSVLREHYGGALLIGRSTHTSDEVAREAEAGADYVTFGPVFASPGKGAPVGIDALADAASHGIPVLALGGVGIAELPRVAAAGAAGAAGIRLFQELRRLPEVVAAAREAFAT
jgi:thiamine-phosphate diphosphorylase